MTVNSAKENSSVSKIAFDVVVRLSPCTRNHVLDGGPHPPHGQRQILGKMGWCNVTYRENAALAVQKMAEPIELPLGMVSGLGPRNCILDGVCTLVRFGKHGSTILNGRYEWVCRQSGSAACFQIAMRSIVILVAVCRASWRWKVS